MSVSEVSSASVRAYLNQYHPERDSSALINEFEQLNPNLQKQVLSVIESYKTYYGAGFLDPNESNIVQGSALDKFNEAANSGVGIVREVFPLQEQGDSDFFVRYFESGDFLISVYTRQPEDIHDSLSAVSYQDQMIRNLSDRIRDNNPDSKVGSVSVFAGGILMKDEAINKMRENSVKLASEGKISILTSLVYPELVEADLPNALRKRLFKGLLRAEGLDGAGLEDDNSDSSVGIDREYIIPDNFFEKIEDFRRVYRFIYPELFAPENEDLFLNMFREIRDKISG
jgi:hypothetical protein